VDNFLTSETAMIKRLLRGCNANICIKNLMNNPNKMPGMKLVENSYSLA